MNHNEVSVQALTLKKSAVHPDHPRFVKRHYSLRCIVSNMPTQCRFRAAALVLVSLCFTAGVSAIEINEETGTVTRQELDAMERELAKLEAKIDAKKKRLLGDSALNVALTLPPKKSNQYCDVIGCGGTDNTLGRAVKAVSKTPERVMKLAKQECLRSTRCMAKKEAVDLAIRMEKCPKCKSTGSISAEVVYRAQLKTRIPYRSLTTITHKGEMKCVTKFGVAPIHINPEFDDKTGKWAVIGTAGSIMYTKAACSKDLKIWHSFRKTMACFVFIERTPKSLERYGHEARLKMNDWNACFKGAKGENVQACTQISPFVKQFPCSGYNIQMSKQCEKYRARGYSCYKNKWMTQHCRQTCFGGKNRDTGITDADRSSMAWLARSKWNHRYVNLFKQGLSVQ